MEKTRFSLGVEVGRDGLHRAALFLIMPTEVWIVFNDMSGICFRRRTENEAVDFSVEDMKKEYTGIYRALALKWNQISVVVKGGSTEHSP